MYIAQLDHNNICIGLTTNANVYGIKTETEDVYGKKYVDGIWVEVPAIESELTQEQAQMNRIENAISKTHEQITNDAVDRYTLSLMESGIL